MRPWFPKLWAIRWNSRKAKEIDMLDNFETSFLHKMRIQNLGCIGPEGLEIALDAIVCLVGANNSGKSTVLRAYEAAVANEKLAESDFCSRRNGAPASVTLWVHIPANTPNIDEKWKTSDGDLKLVQSRWEWSGPGIGPVRTT